MCDNNCNVCDKFKKYKCKQYNNLKPPNIAGKWDRTDFYHINHKIPEIPPSFKEIDKFDDDIVEMNQCGVFVTFRGQPNSHRPISVSRLGIWNPLRAGDGSIFSWQLMVVDNDDNQVDSIQPSKFDKDGKVVQLYCSQTESGFNKDNSLQYPYVGYYYMDRI